MGNAPLVGKPRIIKLGTIDCDMVETTPIVFQSRLYRFEYVRPNYKPNETGISFFRFIDVDSGESTSAFAHGYHLGSAYVDDDRVFAYGVDAWGGSKIKAFWSRDLEEWHSETVLVLDIVPTRWFSPTITLHPISLNILETAYIIRGRWLQHP